MSDLLQQVKAVVRGEAHWSSLQEAGCRIQYCNKRWSFGPSPIAPADIGIEDVEAGLARLMGDPAARREWASFVLAAASLVSLETLAHSARGEKLLDDLWEISVGEAVEGGRGPRP